MVSTVSVAAASSLMSLRTAAGQEERAALTPELWYNGGNATNAPPSIPRSCSVFVAPSTVNESKMGLFAGIPHAPQKPLQVTTQLLIELFDANKNEWSPWMDLFFNGSLLPSLAHDFERDLFLPGIASMFDCFEEDKESPRVNVVATSIDDSRGVQRNHRSTHATAGSYTYHSGFTYTTMHSLAVGQEIFPTCLKNINTHRTPKDELPPRDITKSENSGRNSQHDDPPHHRSIEWLYANAICMDTLDVQPSSVPGIGRGAFAKYAVPIGQPIATTPVLHFDRSQMHRVAQLRDHHHLADLVRSSPGIEYHADHILQEQLLLNYCWSHPLSHVLLLPIGMGVQAINHSPKISSLKKYPNAYLRWKNPGVFGTSQNKITNMLSQTAHQILDQKASLAIGSENTQLWVEIVALKAIDVGDEIFLDYGAEWQKAWDAHEAAWSPSLQPEDQTYISADEYLEHHRDLPLPTVAENEAAPLDKRLPPNLQTACFYRASQGGNSGEESSIVYGPSLHASISCLRPCSIIEREERRVEESPASTFASVAVYYTVQVYNRSGNLSQEIECGVLPVDGARVLNIPAWAVTLADKPYSIDSLVKQAFRHPIGVPQDGFWPVSWMTKDPMPLGDFIHTPLTPGELQVIRWADTGAVVHPNAYRLGFHPHFQRTMMRYCREMGILDVMRHLTVKGNALAASSEAYVTLADEKWYLQRPSSDWRSNLQWLSPGGSPAHQHYLQALSVAGLDEILASIGATLGFDHLVVYQLTFIAISHSVKGLVHTDVTMTQNKAFNVIIPLILANETGPELDLVSSGEKDNDGNLRMGRYRYEPNVGSIVGDDAAHASSATDYRSSKEMRLAATIYIAEITEENADSIINHYTQAFPPQDRTLLLSWAGIHWNATDPTKKLPSPPEDHILLNSAIRDAGNSTAFDSSISYRLHDSIK